MTRKDHDDPVPGTGLPPARDPRDREATLTPRRREGVGLCLSGGGYRAALLHLGALRRLDELGVLARVGTVSGVSGGSLAAAVLAHPGLQWPADGPARVGGFEQHVVAVVRELAGRNIRTPALLARLAPQHWFEPDAAVRALARGLARAGPLGRELRLPTGGPRIVVGSTDLVFGVDWVAETATDVEPARVGSYRAGHTTPDEHWTLADACATSCAIPPFFAPHRVPPALGARLTGGRRNLETAEQHRALCAELRIGDGGVYDNLGLEPVWKSHASVLVSDGGAVFRAAGQRTVIGRLARALEILGRSGTSTRLRWLHAAYAREVMGGCTWGIDDLVDGGYPRDVVELLARVRTDLDAFSPTEQQVLERHGYLAADAAVRRHAPELVTIEAPSVPPHPQVADPDVARLALRSSARRTLPGRF